jgi:hypothetical protein
MYVLYYASMLGVGTTYGSWLGLTTLAQGWDVMAGIRAVRV